MTSQQSFPLHIVAAKLCGEMVSRVYVSFLSIHLASSTKSATVKLCKASPHQTGVGVVESMVQSKALYQLKQ